MKARTHFDAIKECKSSSSLGHLLCDYTTECDGCPVEKLCMLNSSNVNGYTRWLEMEDMEHGK